MELKFENHKTLLGIAPYRALLTRYAIGTPEPIGKFIFELKNGVQFSLRFVLIHVELHWAPSYQGYRRPLSATGRPFRRPLFRADLGVGHRSDSATGPSEGRGTKKSEI